MNKLALLLLLIPCLSSCQSKEKEKSIVIESENIVGRKLITDEIAGSVYRDSAVSYFIVNHGDTSSFSPIFIMHKGSNLISLNLNLPYFGEHLTYNQLLIELETILQSASKEFDFQFLSGVTIGRLILTGDLAVDITNEFIKRTSVEGGEELENDKVRSFIFESKLVDDFNELLAPYSLTIKDVNVENIFFTTRAELEMLSNLKLNSSSIPDKILDASIGLKLK